MVGRVDVIFFPVNHLTHLRLKFLLVLDPNIEFLSLVCSETGGVLLVFVFCLFDLIKRW